MSLLTVENLSVTYATKRTDPTHAVRDVSFSLEEGECVGLLGESGSGKSTLGNAMLRLLERPAEITGGRVLFDGQDITALPEKALRPLRWRQMSTVFQSSMNSLNPVMTIEAQFRDTFQAHTDLSREQIRARTGELLEMVLIEPSFMRFHPHELSGGMKQRVAMALALALKPRFVLLDEPTTGLDVVVQRSILDSLRNLQREQGFATLLISHDLGTVMEVTDRVMVMYAGRIAESQTSAGMLREPVHPYTRGLLGSYADPRATDLSVTYIPGRPPDLSKPHTGCLFAARCPEATDTCRSTEPELLDIGPSLAACHVAEARYAESPGAGEAAGKTPKGGFGDASFADRAKNSAEQPEEVLRVEHLNKRYLRRRGRTKTVVDAVSDVSFTLRRGQVTALVGQSGSGKSTLANLVTGIERPDSGTITFQGTSVGRLRSRALRRYRKHIQLVFQDPFAALNPTRTVRQTMVRPLRNHLGMSEQQARVRAAELLEAVGLSPAESFLDRYPYQISGGQRQRIVVARALAPEPEIIVADEPISMLDVSIRAEILELLDTLARTRGIAMLYITHDLLSARLLADEVLVLNQGKAVEHGPTAEVIGAARDEYTRLLLDAVPNPFAEREFAQRDAKQEGQQDGHSSDLDVPEAAR
jgi:peptide/nickel transport system ATP-binding protein